MIVIPFDPLIISQICRVCGITKDLAGFQRSGKPCHAATGRETRCTACKNTRAIEILAEKKAADPTYTTTYRGPIEEVYSVGALSKIRICFRCKEGKTGYDFYRTKQQKCGLLSYCKVCSREYQLERYWADEAYRESVRINGLIRGSRPEIKAQKEAYMTQWVQDNPDKLAMYKASRKANVKQATPEWVNFDEILVVYRETRKLSESTGVMYHVDHKVPLAGKTVCGLHIGINLRPLEGLENIRKSNKFIEVLGYEPPLGIQLHPDFVYPSPY